MWRSGGAGCVCAAFRALGKFFKGVIQFLDKGIYVVEVVQIIPQECIQFVLWGSFLTFLCRRSWKSFCDSTGAGVRAHRGADFRCARSTSLGGNRGFSVLSGRGGDP